jgi:hypothetical protein
VPVYRFFDERITGSKSQRAGPVFTDLLNGPYAVRMLQAFSQISNTDLRRKIIGLIENIASELDTDPLI